MNKSINLIMGFLMLFFLSNCKEKEHLIDKTLFSPDGTIKLTLEMLEGETLGYKVEKSNAIVLESSKLGIIRKDADFSNSLNLLGADTTSIDDQYVLKVGKRLKNNYYANKKVFHFENKDGERMDIIFQVSNDGVAFRYYFPDISNEVKCIDNELTTFNFPKNSRAWMQPCSNAKTGYAKSNPSYEEYYLKDIPVGTPSPIKAGWIYPSLFKSGKNWVVVSEVGINSNYCGTRLQKDAPNGEYFVGFPQDKEVMADGELNPQSTLPWYTPWRILSIGSLKTVTESTLGTDVAEKAIDGDFSWVKPGRASWSWVLLKDDFTIFPVQKEFIDYAAEMGWEYCLVDGLWDTKIGYEKIKELAEYAKTKNVGLLLWYNSAGDWNDTPLTPRNLMLTSESRIKEFTRIKEMGIKGVKIDFFGGDGQSVMKYYNEILEDAAKVGIMVNFHGCTLPRGIHRKYPNLMTMESIKGMEFITFEQNNADQATTHCAMLPFTRNVYDPMDFTPVCFSEIPNIKRHTSNAFELALTVLFTSGIQHYAETAKGMKTVPDFVKMAMKDVPVAWDESIFIDGWPGKYVVMARRSGSKWFVAGINSEKNDKELQMELTFLKGKKGVMVTDGATNRDFIKSEISIDSDKLPLSIKANGGFLMILQ